MLEIVDFLPEHQPFFEGFNRDWIERYFQMEDTDKYVLRFPQEAILEKGGAILIALYNNEVAGTVALKRVDSKVFEFTKMAVPDRFQRKGIAEALSRAAIKRALSLGAGRIILYSQTDLQPAILLYKKLGFAEVPLEPGTYSRANIKMELLLKNMVDLSV